MAEQSPWPFRPQMSLALQAVQPGKSLFLLYALKSSPRLTLLYLYLSDYSNTFLPFIHTICPVPEDEELADVIAKLHVSVESRAVWLSTLARSKGCQRLQLLLWSCRGSPKRAVRQLVLVFCLCRTTRTRCGNSGGNSW